MKQLTIDQMKSIVSDVDYLEGEFNGKLYGTRDGDVTLNQMIEFLEKNQGDNIYIMEHIIQIVKLKNGIK